MNFESLVPAAIAIIFGAGGIYFLIRQSKKDVDGLGGRVRVDAKVAAAHHHNCSLALMMLAKDDAQRQQLVELLKEPVD